MIQGLKKTPGHDSVNTKLQTDHPDGRLYGRKSCVRVEESVETIAGEIFE